MAVERNGQPMDERRLSAYRTVGALAARVMEGVREVAAVCANEKVLADRIRGMVRGDLGLAPRWLSVGIGTNDRHVNNIWFRPREFSPGDLVKVEIGLDLGGYYVEVGETLAPRRDGARDAELREAACQALATGISAARVGNRVVDVSRAIQEEIESRGFEVSLFGAGHAIRVDDTTTDNRVPPWIFNRADASELCRADGGSTGRDEVIANLQCQLTSGMCLALEPIAQGGCGGVCGCHECVEVPETGNTVRLPYWRTVDGEKSAKFVHTIYLTESETIVLTASGGGK